MQPVTITASIWESDRTNTVVAVGFDGCGGEHQTALLILRNAGHAVRAGNYVAAVACEHANPVAAARALFAAELVALTAAGRSTPGEGLCFGFIDDLLALVSEAS